MAYAISSTNSKLSGLQYTLPSLDGYKESNGTQQLDSFVFSDFTQQSFSTAIPASGGTIIGVSGNGGTFTVNNTTDRNNFGATNCYGVMIVSVGTTNNATGYAGLLASGTVLPGFPTPSSGFVTKYEIETVIRINSKFTTLIPGTIRVGFSSSFTNSVPNDGVYFEYDQPSTGGDANWFINHRHDGSSDRVDTNVEVTAAKVYGLYLCVEKDTGGNYSTKYRIRNITDSTDTGLLTGTAAVGNAAYPLGTDDVLTSGLSINKQTTTTTTATTMSVDYFATRTRFPITRTFMNIGL